MACTVSACPGAAFAAILTRFLQPRIGYMTHITAQLARSRRARAFSRRKPLLAISRAGHSDAVMRDDRRRRGDARKLYLLDEKRHLPRATPRGLPALY